MVMSDHGFHSFRRGVNLNTWLVQNGYMAFEGQRRREEDPGGPLRAAGSSSQGVDWSRTKAYAVGLGQIYFNLRGREGQGIVSAGAEYKALQDEMRSKLLTLTDPDNGERGLPRRLPARRHLQGRVPAVRPRPPGRASTTATASGWQDTLGGIVRSVVENNNRKWSGDHCATATEISGGVFFMNRKIATESRTSWTSPRRS